MPEAAIQIDVTGCRYPKSSALSIICESGTRSLSSKTIMQEIQRTATVQPGTEITSVWAIPDRHVPGESDAIILAHGAWQ